MKIEKIPKNILIGVRCRLGLEQDDTSLDTEIEKMTPYILMQKWIGWTLGDESWAHKIIGTYDRLKILEAEP